MGLDLDNKRRDPVRGQVNAKSRRRRKRQLELAAVPPACLLANHVDQKVKLVWLKPSDLKPAQRRVRRADPAQAARVRASMAEFGAVDPILVTGDNEIIDGHVRHAVALEAGLEEVPCIQIDHLTPTQVRTLKIALNRIAEKGVWDFEALQIELQELIVLDAPLEVTGFSPQEIDGLVLVEAEDAAGVEADEAPAVQTGPPVSKLGDVWRMGKHLIACGDARDADLIKALLADELARLILTDPPYNVEISGHVTSGDHREFAMASGEMTEAEFADFNRAWIAACLAVLMDGALVAPFIDWRSIETMIAALRSSDLTLFNVIVWAKSNAGMGSLWRSRHELLPVAKWGTAPHVNNVELGRHGRWRSNVWEYAGASSLGSDARDGLASHPTVKPVAMLEDALLDVTDREDIVLDPFLGSGSTLIAAQNTGRRCRGVELDPLYVDVIIRRWMALTDQEAMLEETGATFTEVAAERAQAVAP